MSDPNWTGRIPRTTRTEYANCGWVYKSTATTRMHVIQGVCGVLALVAVVVMLAWRG